MRKSISIITIFLSCLLLFSACGSEKNEVVGDFTKYTAYNANMRDSVKTIEDSYGIKLSETAEASVYEAEEEFYGEKSRFTYRFTDSGKLNFVGVASKISGDEDDAELKDRYQLLKDEFTELWGEPEDTKDEQGLIISSWSVDDCGVLLKTGYTDVDKNKMHVIVAINCYDFF